MNAKKRKKLAKKARRKKSEAKQIEKNALFIRDWNDLARCTQMSPTHDLFIDKKFGNAWLRLKDGSDKKDCWSGRHYLSTHTFYGKGAHRGYTHLLRQCGFPVTLNNWDDESYIMNYKTLDDYDPDYLRSLGVTDEQIWKVED